MQIDQLIDRRGSFLAIAEDGVATLSRVRPKVCAKCVIGMDLRGALVKFRKLARQRETFTATDLVAITGQHYARIQRWQDAGIIAPCGADGRGRERSFDFATAFVAGVCGSLARQNQTTPVLRSVAELLGVAAQSENSEEARVTATK